MSTASGVVFTLQNTLIQVHFSNKVLRMSTYEHEHGEWCCVYTTKHTNTGTLQ